MATGTQEESPTDFQRLCAEMKEEHDNLVQTKAKSLKEWSQYVSARSRDSVFGFIREHEKKEQLSVPEMVKLLCVTYYDEPPEWWILGMDRESYTQQMREIVARNKLYEHQHHLIRETQNTMKQTLARLNRHYQSDDENDNDSQ